MPKIVNSILFGFVVLACFLGKSQACENPVFKKSVFLEELSDSGFRIDWNPVSNANYYEIKYILRIAEGRTLAQREVTTPKPFYMFSADAVPVGEVLQLIIEVAAQCKAAKSDPAFVQIALKNTGSRCRFEQEFPALKNDELSWVPIKEAQSYLMCFYKDDNQTVCQETANAQNKIISERIALVGVTPICNNAAGTPVYISVGESLPNKFR